MTASSPAKGIVSRMGLGIVRHIEVDQLWMQEKVQEGSSQVYATQGIRHQADIRTKHVAGQVLRSQLTGMQHSIGTERD